MCFLLNCNVGALLSSVHVCHGAILYKCFTTRQRCEAVNFTTQSTVCRIAKPFILTVQINKHVFQPTTRQNWTSSVLRVVFNWQTRILFLVHYSTLAALSKQMGYLTVVHNNMLTVLTTHQVSVKGI